MSSHFQELSYVILAVMMIADFYQQRDTHMSTGTALRSSIYWLLIAFLFNVGYWWHLSVITPAVANTKALQFFTGYLIERLLALDNVFVWLVIFKQFNISIPAQNRLLHYGIALAILLRVVMIAVGIWAFKQFHGLILVFGFILLLTGIKLIFQRKSDSTNALPSYALFLQRYIPFVDTTQDVWWVWKNNRRYFTPAFVSLLLVGFSDVLFALDSLPAIFAITDDVFIIVASNILAILGLRALYFLLLNSTDRFPLLKKALAFILIFIGTKMLLADFVTIPTAVTLLVILGIIGLSIVLNDSMIASPKSGTKQ